MDGEAVDLPEASGEVVGEDDEDGEATEGVDLAIRSRVVGGGEEGLVGRSGITRVLFWRREEGRSLVR